MDTLEIGRKIREQRIYKKITQEKLAEMVDISTTYLSGIERGKKTPSFKVMVDIAKCLDMSFDFILSNEIDIIQEKNVDAELHEFEMMLELLPENELKKQFIKLSWAIANSLKSDNSKK